MSNDLKRIALILAIAVFGSPSLLQAETLVTHYFEGEVNFSDSSRVDVGDRITGTFTYDLDWDDRVADNPSWFFHVFPAGFSLEEYPVGSPIGMSFSVGSMSHRTSMVLELTVDNDNPDDFMYIGSDNLAPTHPLGGYIDLVDSNRSAFSSDRPPAKLDLAAFTDTTFWGSDGQGGSFLASLDMLRVVPEPATLTLVLMGPVVYGALRFGRRARQLRRAWPVSLVLLAVTLVAPARAIQLQTKTIALSGQPVPGGNGTLSSISSAHLNEVGQVAFRAEINEPGRAGVGIFRGDGGPLTQIVRGNQAAPDGNGEFRFIAPFEIDFHLNDSGQVAFYAGLVGVGGSTEELWGHFLGDGQSLAQVVRDKLPTPHGTFSTLSRLADVNNSGQVTITGLPGAFRWGSGTLMPVALRGQSTPFGTLQFCCHEGVDSNDLGQVAFGVDNRGIFRWDEGTLTAIALHGQPAPSGNGTFTFDIPSGGFIFTPTAAINNAGQVLFEAFLTGSSDRYGIFLHDGDSLTQVFRAGNDAVRTGIGTFAVRTAPLLNEAGDVAFVTGAGFTNPVESAVFLFDGDALKEIARLGQQAPDSNGTFSNFRPLDLNDAGQFLFTANLVGTSGGSTDDLALYLTDGDELLQILRKGELFDPGDGVPRAISGIQSAALNNHDQLLFALSFTDNTSGVFLATAVPEPISVTLFGMGAIPLVLRRRWPASRRLRLPLPIRFT